MSVPRSLLDPDVEAVVAAQRLCFAATVTPDGKPNLSPKGTIRILDATHLFFLDIASPVTVRNLRSNPAIEINVIDQLSRRGYRFRGSASLHSGDDIHQRAVAQIAAEEGTTYHADNVVLIEVEEILPVWSPGYDHIPDEGAMRELWAERRAQLDREFEQYLQQTNLFSPKREA